VRIAYITEEFPPDKARGGIATYVAQAAQAMTARGHEVEVFTSSPQGAHMENQGSICVHWIGETPQIPFREAILPVFARRHATNAFDLIEGPEFGADAADIKSRFPRLPLVVRMHTPSLWLGKIGGDYPPRWRPYIHQVFGQWRLLFGAWRRGRQPAIRRPFSTWWGQMDAIESAHARTAEIVACPCRDLMDYAIRRWRVPAIRVRYLPYVSAPTSDFLNIPIETNSLRIGFFGRLEQRKGVLDLAKAIPSVLKKYPAEKFRLVGRSMRLPESGIMADDAIKSSLGSLTAAVEFRGQVAPGAMAREYADVDLCVFPSIWENFPNVCLEAMAAGRGIVGSNAGGMAEMLADGAGLLVPPRNPSRLAEAICSLLRDPAKRHDFGRRARRRLLEEYNTEKVGQMMETVYSEAIAIARAA